MTKYYYGKIKGDIKYILQLLYTVMPTQYK